MTAAGPAWRVDTAMLVTPKSNATRRMARDAVFMNPDDAATLRLRNSDRVTLVNQHGRYEARIFFAPIARGNLQVHWPEANHLISRGKVDAMGGVPDYNFQVKVEPR